MEIDEPAAQLGIRFAVAQLIAVAPQVGSRTSVAAKGLTGEGYKGHVFWDTDVFLMQFYAYTMPEVAREIIGYRVGTLPAARRNAENAGLEGAWFAWESAASWRGRHPRVRDRAGWTADGGQNRRAGDPRGQLTSPWRSRCMCVPRVTATCSPTAPPSCWSKPHASTPPAG